MLRPEVDGDCDCGGYLPDAVLPPHGCGMVYGCWHGQGADFKVCTLTPHERGAE